MKIMCEILGVSTSGFYDWWNRDDGPRQEKRIELCTAITDAHTASTLIFNFLPMEYT